MIKMSLKKQIRQECLWFSQVKDVLVINIKSVSDNSYHFHYNKLKGDYNE